ncbi:MAG: hypothetical protein ACM4D3_02690 [Candidatus Sericytochromatia bacterium]
MSIFGAATIAMAVGGLAEPAVSQAVWDIGAYDSCEKAAHDRWIRENRTNQQLRDDLRFCCDRSGGEWSQTQDCTAPAAAQTDPTPTLPPNVTPGGTIFTRPSQATTKP